MSDLIKAEDKVRLHDGPLIVYNRYICLIPTKSILGKWQMFQPVYEIDLYKLKRPDVTLMCKSTKYNTNDFENLIACGFQMRTYKEMIN